MNIMTPSHEKWEEVTTKLLQKQYLNQYPTLT